MERPIDLPGITFKVPVAFTVGQDAALLSHLETLLEECKTEMESALFVRLEHLLQMWGKPAEVTHMYVNIGGLRGRPLEIFTTIGKVGSSVSVMADAISRLASGWLQEGVSAEQVIKHLELMHAERTVPWPAAECLVSSIPDGIAKAIKRWLRLQEREQNQG